MKNEIPDLLRSADVPAWDDTADVLIIGYGISGACAALEARGAGADVLVSNGRAAWRRERPVGRNFYLGGGTGCRRRWAVMTTPTGCTGSSWQHPSRTPASCAASATIPWRISIGWRNRACHSNAPGTRTRRSLRLQRVPCITGNEKVWPYFEIAAGAARHKCAKEGDGGGAVDERVVARCTDAGVRARCDSRVTPWCATRPRRIEACACARRPEPGICAPAAAWCWRRRLQHEPELIAATAPRLPEPPSRSASRKRRRCAAAGLSAVRRPGGWTAPLPRIVYPPRNSSRHTGEQGRAAVRRRGLLPWRTAECIAEQPMPRPT